LVGLCAALAATAAGSGPRAQSAPVFQAPLARAIDAPGAVLRRNRLARTAIDWHCGPTATSTGETVTVLVSNTYAVGSPACETWAEFLVKLAHGPELATLTTYIAPLDEVEIVCGARALGCYSTDEMISMGEPFPDGTTPEEVVRHEYGHHIAMNRLNPPWRAIDWGPKYWASAAQVCARAARGEVYPGDEGQNYELNPGEAWAETYRLMDERRAGIFTGGWQIVSQSFFPDDAALQAAERDVLQPWTAGQRAVFQTRFTKKGKKVWLVPLRSPLDGNLLITAVVPAGGRYEVALLAPNRRTVLKKAFSAGPRTKRIATSICGQRSLFLRVTPSGTFGRVSVTASTP
jgi:hypothetical protein